MSPGMHTRQMEVDGVRYAYAVYVPPGEPPQMRAGERQDRRRGARGWPCVLFLHGAGECGVDGVQQTKVGLGPAVLAAPQRWPCVVLFPQKPSAVTEWEEHEPFLLEVLERTQRELPIDPDRIALTGLSQGGHGAWVLAARHPQRWSCVAPLCGYGQPLTVSPRVAGLRVWAFHGERDEAVSADFTRRIIAGIRQVQREQGQAVPEARMTLYPELGHNCWDAAYAEEELARWMLGR